MGDRDSAAERNEPADGRRLDQWLWYARFFKSRSMATRFCAEGRLRINAQTTLKAHHALKVGDVLTFVLGPRVRIVKVLALGRRRGPAPEAQSLYEDLSPPPPPRADADGPVAARDPGAGRPTKAERRAIDRLKAFD